jgi:hypothetical protein
VPAIAVDSSRLPTGTHTPKLALRTPGIASVTTRSPPGSTVVAMHPPPEVSRVLVFARRIIRQS